MLKSSHVVGIAVVAVSLLELDVGKEALVGVGVSES